MAEYDAMPSRGQRDGPPSTVRLENRRQLPVVFGFPTRMPRSCKDNVSRPSEHQLYDNLIGAIDQDCRWLKGA